MSWVSSTFGDDIQIIGGKKKSKKVFYQKPSKKQCINLWVDEYPIELVDLAVHKKKIQEVQNWLTESSKKVKERRILLITGPPGAAKSTSIRALSSHMNLSLREWNNSSSSLKQDFNFDNDFNSFRGSQGKGPYEHFVSQSDRFSDFIFRSSKYANICLTEKSSSSVILIEELPNVFTMNPFEFQLILKKYSSCCTSPIIFIISDCNKNNSLKTLFPPEFQEELFITNIVFNPISASLLLIALTRILNLSDNANSPFFDSISTSKKQFLQMVAERSGGDVRSAVNSLQFTLMRGSVGVSEAKTKKGSKKKSDLSETFVGCKDSNLVLFRALGKVLYCKREPLDAKEKAAPPLPPHLKLHERTPLLEDPEHVFERSASDASTFSLFLHHNCIPFFGDINDYCAASAYLGDADILDNVWDPHERLKTYSSSISIRGLMHSLKGVPKGSHTFRSLTRPSWFNYVHTARERTHKVKHVVRNSSISSEELFSIYVPFLPKAVNADNTEVDRFINEVGLLYPLPRGSSVAKGINSSLVSNDTLAQICSRDEEESEEFCIEEFED